MRLRSLPALLFLITGRLLGGGGGSAHSLGQVKGELEATGNPWHARLWIPAWTAFPENSLKASTGEDGSAGQACLDTLGPGDL
ncbi:hypothetical protein [Haloferula sargassicola]